MKVVITDRALLSLETIIDHLLSEEVPVNTIRKLRDDVLKHAEQLAEHPHSGQLEPYLDHLSVEYRRIVVNKHYKIIYRIEKEVIYLTDIFDSRQDPSTMKG